MSGERSHTEEPAGSGAPSRLRALHADRDRVVDVLRIAAGDGRLTSDELDDRLEAPSPRARWGSWPSSRPICLPRTVGGTPAEVKDVIRIEQQGSSARRDGRWVVPRQMEISSSWGEVTLDFNQAVITRNTLRIDLDLRGSALNLLTRPGIVVDTDALATGYAKIKTQGITDAGAPETLRIELVGQVNYGRVLVRPQRRSFRQWLLREPAAHPSRTG
ncbi:hypothetical protein MBT84_37005 [Streptomyces sp. MBT84]|uniref:DUF1707 SHOCT-like domain-containing protein n=1 Tax=Streptomyces sp. MBT84 TaxID=1488414 RepID=UPI001D223B83|nr:DUF1707 domain-containing protein [Streptomyces sp. MBT84]MBW8705213.1 hypothetical protein [Streptomyces sp. MBT84]